MKTKFTALALITVTALSLAPKPAQASDKGLAIIGGFLGGLIIASAINDSRHDDYPQSYNTVIATDRCDDRGPSGYWRDVSVEVWVPACWVVEGCDRYGREVRRYVAGHNECRTNRVWVSYDRHERYDRRDRDDRYDRRDRNDRDSDRGYDRHDREVSNGYGHRR